MSDTNLAERVCELEERVDYLERELDLSFDRYKFERKMEYIFPSDADVLYSDNTMGYVSAEACLEPHEMSRVIEQVQGMDEYGWQIISNEDGETVIRVGEGLIK